MRRFTYRWPSHWELAYAVNLALASFVSYQATTRLVALSGSRDSVLLGGMWSVVATVFVFRDSREQSLEAGLSRLFATALSLALCLVYLLVFPFTAAGLAVLIGVGALILAALDRRGDIVTTSITTAVIMVVAAISPHDAWHQPLLRFLDTVVGIAVGVAFKWAGSALFGGLASKGAADGASLHHEDTPDGGACGKPHLVPHSPRP
jgi:hypothetical protein